MSKSIDEPISLSPKQFEAEVENIIRRAGVGLSEFRVQRLEKIDAADGIYEIDVTARFEALGASFLVLIECKHHKSPIKREVVQILYDRLRAVGGHKGMIFSTVKFQKGAVEFAQAHGIGLVQVTSRNILRLVTYIDPIESPPEHCHEVLSHIGWIMRLNEEGNVLYQLIFDSDPQSLLEPFTETAT